ncbi:hypothetical protein DFH06DRAFT_1251006 [Mycena polygramma]|nr:hypothetical protein DFH06DRAFT_1251006 [Mycena polygramma]
MPLGLSGGPTLLASPRIFTSSFVVDTSPLGLAMSPRGNYLYGRVCGAFEPVACPGNTNGNTSVIAPEVIARFNATPYGPAFAIEFRRYYNGTSGYNYTTWKSQFSTTESLILRSGIFAVGGLIVDMDNPGIGLRNHTFPANTPHGGQWSEDVLWLEPASTCVDTNLTFDYMLSANNSSPTQIETYTLTDRGGFFNLTTEYPPLNRDGQSVDLFQHAYKGAVLSNAMAMTYLSNLTRNETYNGRTFPLNNSATGFSAGTMQALRLGYLQSLADLAKVDALDPEVACEGYGGQDTANISNVAVHCYMLLAPSQRSDGGDPRLPADNSRWSQRLFSCAGATRARMQRIGFSFNGTMDLSALGISRSNLDSPVLWATEKTDLSITDVDLFWGRVPDNLEGDPTLWTTRSDIFYVPAGAVDTWGVVASGQPSTLPGLAWTGITQIGPNSNSLSGLMDYSGVSNFALLNKFQTLIATDSEHGVSQIQSLVWTDLMSNNALGSASNTSLLVQENVPSIAYDLRFAVPAFLLFLLWIPLFSGTVFVLITGLLKLSYVKHLLNHTGAGRVALGTSALKPLSPEASRHTVATASPGTAVGCGDEKQWAKNAGRTPVCIQPAGWSGIFSESSTEFVPLSTYEK